MSKEQNSFDFFEHKDVSNVSKRVLITGGFGFIGTNLIKYLIKKYPNYKIINFDKLTYAANYSNLAEFRNSFNYISVKGDIADSKDVKNVFEEYNPNYVINLAAESNAEKSILNPDVSIQTNILGTQVLLNHARENNIEKFVHASSYSVYGTAKHSNKETDALNPNTQFAAGKASADFLVRVAYESYGQRVNIIRSSNNYGNYQFPDKFIPTMILNALENKELPVHGDGKNIRDWLHVEDHCHAIDVVLHKGKPGEIYNVASQKKMENIELVEYILDKLNCSKNLVRFILNHPEYDQKYAVDISKIRNELGWSPKIKFDDGIEQTIQWYKTNRKWLNDISSGDYLKNFSI